MQLALTGVESVEPEEEPEWLDTGEPETPTRTSQTPGRSPQTTPWRR